MYFWKSVARTPRRESPYHTNVRSLLLLSTWKNKMVAAVAVTGLKVRIFTLVIKLLLCLLYVIRVFLDRGPDHAACYGCDPVNVTIFRDLTPEQEISYNDMRPRTNYINWNAVVWVDRPLTLWIFQKKIGTKLYLMWGAKPPKPRAPLRRP
ncbi:hypothetical protein AVEN_209871-1 [Araneus ventricosus]|uniref:Uncharacterized protein n=1 Tax=Araneus ventricosus TaxID=182803 RepID=A0A4Y2PVI5_ARAVE|nr:hypothetical protein AVEN_209871-1 [Araneus ventricosus]